jgi:ABC-type cobalamin/Fe3+-siderophores transport system ATPase subunit
MKLLEVRQLACGYGTRSVFKDVSFDLPAGCLLAVLGPNGSGKSTLLKTIAGVLPPLVGTIDPLTKLDPRERAKHVAYSPQQSIADWPFTVREFVSLGRSPHTGWWNNTADTSVVQEQLVRWKIDHLADRCIQELSGGEFQRTRLAMTCTQQCPLFLLDEPLASIDPLYQYQTLQLLRDEIRTRQASVVMTLHDVNIATRWADLVLLLNPTGVVGFGNVIEVISPANLALAYGLDFDVSADGYISLPGRG